MEYFISFDIPGEVEVAERLSEFPYETGNIVEVSGHDVHLAVLSPGPDDDNAIHRPDSLVKIKLDAVHVTSPASGRTFHVHLNAFLTREEARFLHASLGALVAHGRTYDPE